MQCMTKIDPASSPARYLNLCEFAAVIVSEIKEGSGRAEVDRHGNRSGAQQSLYDHCRA